MSVLELMFIII